MQLLNPPVFDGVFSCDKEELPAGNIGSSVVNVIIIEVDEEEEAISC